MIEADTRHATVAHRGPARKPPPDSGPASVRFCVTTKKALIPMKSGWVTVR